MIYENSFLVFRPMSLQVLLGRGVFRFGPSKQYVSKRMVELSVIMRRMDGKEDVLRVFTYSVDADVPFFVGREQW